jgi:nitroimidazol reductase NimA-like FMN-containing flavoprotein (pyridoxamine 5'-phosphate oxidase superfamily)
LPQRADYDQEVINRILDEGLVCQVGIVEDGQPVVIPTVYTRIENRIVVHGSRASRLMRTLASGGEACVCVTLVDGLVLARSAFHHSMNYRSVIAFGKGVPIEDLQEKNEIFRLLMERLAPGRWRTIRTPNEKELQQTSVVAIPMEEASAKIRVGPPKDDEEDYLLPIWAGILPLRTAASMPIADPSLSPEVSLPDHLAKWVGKVARMG